MPPTLAEVPAPAAGPRPQPQPVWGRSAPPRVVIVGSGFGGLYAARHLRRAPVEVTLVDRRNHHLFQPLLYQVATAVLSPGDIAYPIRTIFRGRSNIRVLLAEATAVDLQRRKVHLRDGELDYDYLILAPGSTHTYFGHNEWEASAPSLKSLEDALEVRRRILLAFEKAERESDLARRRQLLTFAIIGGGPTGVELAGAIAEIARQVMVRDFRSIDSREARVLLIEAGPRLLPEFAPDLSAEARRELEHKGVEVRTGEPVTYVDREQIRLNGQSIPAATTLWAAGVAPSPLGRMLGVALDRRGRVPVNVDLSLPGHPEVYVVGDLASCRDKLGRQMPGLAPVAMQEGRHAAANILRAVAGRPLRPFRYFDKGILATIGRAAAVAQIGPLHLSGLVAWWTWVTVHISYLIGFRNRLVVMLEWAWSYLSYQRAARLITGDIDAVYPVREIPAESREAR